MKRMIWRDVAQRMKKAAAIVTALTLALSLVMAQPAEAAGVTKIAIVSPLPEKGDTSNIVVIPKGVKTKFTVGLKNSTSEEFFNKSEAETVFSITKGPERYITISEPEYRKNAPHEYWVSVDVLPKKIASFNLRAKVKNRSLYTNWTVKVSTAIDRIVIIREEGDTKESVNGAIMVGDELIANALDPDGDYLTTAQVQFQWYLIKTDGTMVEVAGEEQDEELHVTNDMVGCKLRVEATPVNYLTGSASCVTSEAVCEYQERTEKPDAPNNLGKQDCSAYEMQDGKITGVTTAMEYQLKGDSYWTRVTGYEITGLASGTYYVRYMATNSTLASDITSVVVNYNKTTNTVDTPVFSPKGGSFSESLSVGISSETEGADIYYTLDDSEPTVSSAKYSGPIHVSQTTTVRAIAVKDGMNNSPVVSETYEIIGEESGPEFTKEPTGISNLMYDGKEHDLITAGEVKNGELYYAVQKVGAEESTDTLQYRNVIPSATEAGTYHVWYQAIGDNDHSVSDAAYVSVTINQVDATDAMKTAAVSIEAKNGKTATVSYTLPDGASYGDVLNSNADFFTVSKDNGLVLTAAKVWTESEWATDAPKTFTVPVTGATNYKNYTLTVSVTPTYHQHSFSYSASGATITATCDNTDRKCPLTDKKVTLTLSAADATYTGSAYTGASLSDTTAWMGAGLTAPTIEYEGRGNTSYTKNKTAPTNVGTYSANITVDTNKTATVDFTISPIALTIDTVTAADRAYNKDSTAVTISAVTFKDSSQQAVALTPGEDKDYAVTGAMTDANAGDGKTVNVSVTLKNANYSLATSTTTATVNIGKAAAQTIADVTDTLLYTATSVSETVAGKMPADAGELTYTKGNASTTGSVTVSGFVVDTDGNVSATLSGGAAGDTITLPVTIGSTNYADSTVNVKITLTAKSDAGVDITGAPESAMTYGDADFILTGSVTNAGTGTGTWIWTSSDSTVLQITANGTSATVKILKAGSATVTAKYESDTTLDTETTDTITVNSKTITIAAKNQSIYVGGTVPDLGTPVLDTHYTVTGLVGSDVLTTPPTLKYQKNKADATPDNNTAGTYDIVPSGASAGANYNISYANGTLTITAKDTQTITAENITAVYGDTGKKVTATTNGNGAISYAVTDGSTDYINVDATTGALTIKKAGTATVVVTAAETMTYAPATKEVTVTISKADPTATAPTGLTATYGQTLANVSLDGKNPQGNIAGAWAWVNSSTSVGSVGNNTFKANFTPTDTTNYNSASNVDVTVTVNKADPAANAPTGLTATYGQTLADVALTNPDGNTDGTWVWVDSSASVGNVGNNTFNTNFTPTDMRNYNSVNNVPVTIIVGKAANPTTVSGTATVKRGGNTVDLAENVTLNGATGDVSYAISGETNGCSLSGSTLASGNTTGTVTVNVTVATDNNYEALAATPVTVTITDKDTQTISASDVTATYGDTNKSVSATTDGNGAISYAVKDGSADYIDVDATTGALTIKKVPSDGKAYVVVTAAETMTYAPATKVVTVTISKANAASATVTANNRTYEGAEKPLMTITGEATGGTMQYAIGTKDAATQPYTTSIPTATDAGTYYVWYKVKGDDNHTDTTPVCIPVTISAVETVTITFDAGGGTGSMAPVGIEKGSKFTFPTPKFFPPEDRVFAHWRIGEKHFVIYDEITVTADLTVTAVWTEPKSRIETNDLTSVPKELKNTYSSITALKKALLSRLSSNGIFASEENTEFHDVELMVQLDGIHWVKATEANFPVGKLTVKLAYPSGTGMNTHNFKVAHMFATNVHGHQPGQIETPPVTKGESGITVELDGLSPVAISWNKIDEKAIGSLPQTGDTAKPLLYGFLALIALVGIGLLIKKK